MNPPAATATQRASSFDFDQTEEVLALLNRLFGPSKENTTNYRDSNYHYRSDSLSSDDSNYWQGHYLSVSIFARSVNQWPKPSKVPGTPVDTMEQYPSELCESSQTSSPVQVRSAFPSCSAPLLSLETEQDGLV